MSVGKHPQTKKKNNLKPKFKLFTDMDLPSTPKVPSSDKNLVQISATHGEIEQRINTFMATKRQQVDESNVKEFRSADPAVREETCARTDAQKIKRSLQMKTYKVENEVGPQSPPPHNLDPLKAPPSALEERLKTLEDFLNKNIPPPPIPLDVYERVKRLEARLLVLEEQAIENGIPFPPTNLSPVTPVNPSTIIPAATTNKPPKPAAPKNQQPVSPPPPLPSKPNRPTRTSTKCAIEEEDLLEALENEIESKLEAESKKRKKLAEQPFDTHNEPDKKKRKPKEPDLPLPHFKESTKKPQSSLKLLSEPKPIEKVSRPPPPRRSTTEDLTKTTEKITQQQGKPTPPLPPPATNKSAPALNSKSDAVIKKNSGTTPTTSTPAPRKNTTPNTNTSSNSEKEKRTEVPPTRVNTDPSHLTKKAPKEKEPSTAKLHAVTESSHLTKKAPKEKEAPAGKPHTEPTHLSKKAPKEKVDKLEELPNQKIKIPATLSLARPKQKTTILKDFTSGHTPEASNSEKDKEKEKEKKTEVPAARIKLRNPPVKAPQKQMLLDIEKTVHAPHKRLRKKSDVKQDNTSDDIEVDVEGFEETIKPPPNKKLSLSLSIRNRNVSNSSLMPEDEYLIPSSTDPFQSTNPDPFPGDFLTENAPGPELTDLELQGDVLQDMAFAFGFEEKDKE